MYRWRSRILFALIIYFAGFATAIYALAPVADANVKSDLRARTGHHKVSKHADSGSKSEKFASAFNTQMRKCISIAEEQGARLGELIKAKLAEQRTKDE
ncbi:MAG: hypothetical protein ACYTFK_10240 [Planctomycetota bacterium]|jgi:hypothetical protein